MTEPGGSAAINGFLYQILATLWHVSQIHLKTKLDGQEIRSARLILEPKGGGGDTRYEDDDARVVEQYKTRGPNRTWSLKDLIENVLPDLFVDVDPNGQTGTSKYRFVTDGRCGRIGHFRRFLNNFSTKPVPVDPPDSLDNIKKYPFFGQGGLTDRALFL